MPKIPAPLSRAMRPQPQALPKPVPNLKISADPWTPPRNGFSTTCAEMITHEQEHVQRRSANSHRPKEAAASQIGYWMVRVRLGTITVVPLIVIGTLIDCAVAFGVAGVFAALVLPFASGPEAFMALPQPTPVMAIANKSAAKAKFTRRCLRGIASGRAAAQSKIASSKSPPDGEGETKAEEAAGVTVRRAVVVRSEEHTSELQSPVHLVCRLLLEKKK